MKKLFELQLFADDSAEYALSSAPVKTGTGNDSESKPESKPEAKAEKKYSDEDVDKMFARKFAEWQKKQQKEVDEAKKLAEMNAQQKAEYERDQLQKELDSLKKKDALAEMTKTARKMLSDSGVSVSDELLALMVTADAEKTKSAVDGFSKMFKEAVESAVKERLKGEPPKRGAGGGVAPMTKEEIMKIRDPELRQLKMLENKHLFNMK